MASETSIFVINYTLRASFLKHLQISEITSQLARQPVSQRASQPANQPACQLASQPASQPAATHATHKGGQRAACPPAPAGTQAISEIPNLQIHTKAANRPLAFARQRVPKQFLKSQIVKHIAFNSLQIATPSAPTARQHLIGKHALSNSHR